MAAGGRIQGITIQLGADTTSLVAALKDSNAAISKTQKELKMVERALQLNPGNTELIRQKQELLQQAVAETTTKLDALRQAQAEVERKFQAGEISATEYRSFQRELLNTEAGLNRLSQELSEMGQDANNAGRDIAALGDKVKNAGEGIKGAGQKMMGVTAGLGALGGAAGLVATEFDNMGVKIRNSVAGTEEELSGLENSAKSVWRQGFGESMDDVSNAIIQVKNNMKGLKGEEIEQATKSALVLGQTFDADVNEVTRAGNNLMQNFGLDSEQAFDLMAQGAKNGLNFSNEMFDNLSEYSGLFADMGYSGEEYFQLLVNGSKAGIYNLDYLNDVMKENQIRLKDGSKSTADAMGQMSKSTQQLWKDHLAGKATVKEVSSAVLTELEGMDDQTKANQIGVALYGTKWEDLEADAMYALNNMGTEMQNADGTMQTMIETQEQAFGQRFQSMMRTAKESLLPLGLIVLDLAERYLPPLIEKITGVAEWFSKLSDGTQKIIVGIGIFVAALAPLLTILGTVVSAIGSLIVPVMNVFSWFSKLRTLWVAVQGVLAVLTGALTWPVAAIAAVVAAGVLLYKNWDTVKQKAGELKDWTVKKFTELKDGASKAIDAAKTAITEKWNALKTGTSNIIESMRAGVAKTFESLKNGVITIATAVKDNVTARFTSLKTAVTTVVDGTKTAVVNGFNILKNGITTAVTGAHTTAVNGFNTLKNGMTNAVNTAKTAVVNAFNLIKSGITTAVNATKSTVQNVFSLIQSLMTSPVTTAKGIINRALTDIKNLFSKLDLKFPSIKMPKLPKFKLTGEFSLNPPSVPKLSVSWNAQGGIFNKPTIFNTPAGLQGVGEAGKEAVLPLTERVLGGIGKGIAATMKGAQQIIINPQPIYLDGELIGNVTFDTINERQFTAAQLAAISKGVQIR